MISSGRRSFERLAQRAKLLGGYLSRDAQNWARFGAHAPRSAQMIRVDPREIHYAYLWGLWEEELPPGFTRPARTTEQSFGREFSGRVLGGDWDLDLVELKKCPKYSMCLERFQNGMSWEEAGAYELMGRIVRTRPGADGCFSEDDIVCRYERLDELFNLVAKERTMRRRREMSGWAYREYGGIYLHIGRASQIVFSGDGFHRLAIAKVLGLESIPAQLGVVHEAAVEVWKERYAPIHR